MENKTKRTPELSTPYTRRHTTKPNLESAEKRINTGDGGLANHNQNCIHGAKAVSSPKREAQTKENSLKLLKLKDLFTTTIRH